jgi:hypothetical protein
LVANVDGRGRESNFCALSGQGNHVGLELALSDTTNEALRSPTAEGLKGHCLSELSPHRLVESSRIEELKKQYPLMCAARLSALQLWSAAARLPQQLPMAVLRNSILQPNTTLA